MGPRALLIFPVLAGVLTVVLYGTTVQYGFYYDDYHFVRPYTPDEVAATFRGPWDATGIEVPYFRPLTICLYALRFWLLGLNSAAHHALSLTLFAAAATLFALFAAQALGTRIAAFVALVFFIVHPGMPYSAVAWITNQMHLAQLLVVLGALVWWFAVRRRTFVWWVPLLVAQAAAFAVKEDGVMLIPAVLALHLLRKALVERDLRVPVAFIVASVLLLSALFWWRSVSLAGLTAIRAPSVDQAWTNFVRGLSGPFALIPAKRPFQLAASWFVVLLPAIALLRWHRLSPSIRFGLVAGVVLGALFDLPFVFLVKAEQLHLVTAGACLTLAAAAAGLVETFPARPIKAAALVTVLAGAAAMALVAANIATDFDPYGPSVLRTDRIVQEWAAVPVELREYLAAKTERGQRPPANPVRALKLVAFGLHGREIDPAGLPVRWMAGPAAELFLARETRLVAIPLRHEIGAFREPAQVRVAADGEPVQTMTLADGAWHTVNVPLRPRLAPWIGRMHRVRIEIERVWVPSNIIPGSTDGRTLGLQIGAIDAR